ncbi:C39 family peptidase [Deinococcus sp.]|uniref:C39 family peptidase n=1 Tax=Deinococcus sp. TaxID=47478 RepID=UPI003CC57BDC
MKFFGSRFSALRRRLALGTLLAIGLVQAAASGPAPVHPLSAYLAAVGYVHQSYNNCGPASIVSVLAYYGVSADQSELARVLRPEGGYMASEVIAPFVQRYGLRATLFKGGRLEHLRQLAAAGIPVIVLQWMNRVGSAPHFRVVRGYDDHSGLMWLSDPIYGPNVYVSYANFQTLWNLYDQEFIPVYRPQQTAQVSRILGVRL